MANSKDSTWADRMLPSLSRSGENRRAVVPEGLWKKCTRCESVLYRPDLERNLNVCPKCNHHMRITARHRLRLFLDEDPQTELGAGVEPEDFLKFRDTQRYRDRIANAQRETGEKDALVVLEGQLKGLPLVASAFEFSFMGGSMGSVVGERFMQGINTCLQKQIPFVCFSASGGARMQEALVSLMQMAKTSAGIGKMRRAGLPYISVMTDPVYGGVSASLAMLGEINLAEPRALAGFAGPRVIEQTVREKLPDGFQRSEFLLDHGFVDMIVERRHMRDTIARLLSSLTRNRSESSQ